MVGGGAGLKYSRVRIQGWWNLENDVVKWIGGQIKLFEPILVRLS